MDHFITNSFYNEFFFHYNEDFCEMNFFIKDNLAQNHFANIVISHIYYTFIKSAMKNIRVSRLSFMLLLFFFEM